MLAAIKSYMLGFFRFEDEQMRLESSSSLGKIMRFMLRTYDGLYAVSVSLFYLFMGGRGLLLCNGECGDFYLYLGFLFMPFLIFVVYVRHRFGTESENRRATFFCMISITFLASFPFFKN